MKIGVIREGKVPSDSRVCLTPKHCEIIKNMGFDIKVQPSEVRSYKNKEYEDRGIILSEDMGDRDVLLGVKEVPINQLIAGKTYFFFSHTIKEQAYNRKLLRTILEKKIRLIDYEVIKNEQGVRLIAFGRFAGIVGAHNGIYTYLKGRGIEIPRMIDFFDFEEAKAYYKKLDLPPIKIVLTGTGRVASGAVEVLEAMGIKHVSPVPFICETYDHAVFTQLNSFYYAKRKDGQVFTSEQDFYEHPGDYDSDFHHFVTHADVFINGIYWDNNAPAFFTVEEMNDPEFRINTIADVTCDIAPVSSIPSTLRATTIEDPIFGFDPKTGKETDPFQPGVINMMTIDNLPNELPRDASEAFGDMFLEHVFPELTKEESQMLNRASITTKNGALNTPFHYLEGFVS